MFASFDSKMTILESYPELIIRENRDIAASVKEILRKKGIEFRMNAKVQSINYTNKTSVTQIIDLPSGQIVELESEAVLLATGRKPNTEQLRRFIESCY
ncbi:FAD-dependent oxidoreductase [Bacteroides sp.]|uniref:FAD-dependent oxidoreductase n=2 Tax=Bacteroides sp. TaxID=29523 RepID=UPI0004B8D976